MSSSPAIIRRAVDFPGPDGPTRIMNSPSLISRLMSLTASKPSGNRLETFSSCISAIGEVLPLLRVLQSHRDRSRVWREHLATKGARRRLEDDIAADRSGPVLGRRVHGDRVVAAPVGEDAALGLE